MLLLVFCLRARRALANGCVPLLQGQLTPEVLWSIQRVLGRV